MARRKHLIDASKYNRVATPQELAFNEWYYGNMEKYGLFSDFDSNSLYGIDIETLQRYEDDKVLAMKYLKSGKELPKDLAKRLLIAKEQKEKVQKINTH